MTDSIQNHSSLKKILWQAICDADPGRTALQTFTDPETGTDGEKITYQEFANEVRRLSDEFLSKGLKGKRIGILAERKISVIISFLACLISECPAVLLNPEEDDEANRTKLAETGCAILAGAPGWKAGVIHEPAISGEAFLFFTSGTTGREKCVIRTGANTLSAVSAAAKTLHHGPMQLLNIPLYHSNTINRFLLPSLMKGCTITLSRGPRNWLKEIISLSPDELFGVPAQAALFLDLMKGAEEEKPSSLQYFISAGAVFPEKTQKALLSLGIQSLDAYGCSEAGLIANPICAGGRYQTRPGSVGRLMPDLIHRIDTPDSDGYGELLLKGPSVFPGYLGNEEETKAILKDGWLHTGDRAKIDEDGFLYLNGRVKNLIILESGENVSPEELEEIFGKTEGVRECLCFEYKNVIAMEIVPDKAWFAAHAELDPKSFLREKTDGINGTLPSWKRVSCFYLRKEPLPRTSTGKPKRTGLIRPEEDDCVLLKAAGKAEEESKGLSPEDAVRSAFETAFPGRMVNGEEDFFALGGDSLSAMTIASVLGEIGYPVNARDLFAHPSVPELAEYLLQGGAKEKETADREVREAKELLESFRGKTIAPEIPEDELSWIRNRFSQMTVEAVYPYEAGPREFRDLLKEIDYIRNRFHDFFLDRLIFLKEPMEESVFFARMQTITGRHPALRRRYIRTTGGWRQVILKEADVPAFYNDLSSDERNDAEKLKEILADYQEHLLQKEKEAMPEHLKVSCFKLSGEKCVILFEQTHLDVDRWSTDLILRELITGTKEKEEDNYHLYQLWKMRKKSGLKKETERILSVLRTEIPRSAFLPGRPAAHSEKVLIREETIVTRFNPALSASINEYCARERITPSEFISFVFYQAFMENEGVENAFFQEHFSGREGVPIDIRDCYGHFSTRLQVFLQRSDTPKSYHERLARFAKYSQDRYKSFWEFLPLFSKGLVFNKMLFDTTYLSYVESDMSLRKPSAPTYRENFTGISYLKTTGRCYRIETRMFADDKSINEMEKLGERTLEMAALLVSKGKIKNA